MQKRKLERLRFDHKTLSDFGDHPWMPKKTISHVFLNRSLTNKGSLGFCQSSGSGSSNGNGEFGNCSRPPIPSDLELSCSSGGF